MLRYMWEMALAKGEVQRRIPSVTTATRQATSKWTARPKEVEKKGKDRQVKDGEMAAKLLPILLPAPAPPPDNYTFATAASIQVGQGSTIIDSGATSHFCPDHTKFITFEAIKAQDICTADRSTISALGWGDIKVGLPLGNKYTTATPKNTLYTPKMVLTLISAHQITAAGFTIQFENDTCKTLSPTPKRKLITPIAQVNSLYAIPTTMEESTHMAKLTINELHRALGHVAQGAVQYTVKQGLIEGVGLDSASTLEFYDACTKARATRQPFPAETTMHAPMGNWSTRTCGDLLRQKASQNTYTTSVSPMTLAEK
jgi:hypothetical protein